METNKEMLIKVTVNNREITATISPQESLLDFLRFRAEALEVKCGCNKGDCGTCTVVFDGLAVKSCLVLAIQANGKQVWTIKGLEEDPLMQRLQESFVNHGAIQCGFCTPGMLVSSWNLLKTHTNPDTDAIRQAISGNLCRCTGYKKIVDAVAAVAAAL